MAQEMIRAVLSMVWFAILTLVINSMQTRQPKQMLVITDKVPRRIDRTMVTATPGSAGCSQPYTLDAITPDPTKNNIQNLRISKVNTGVINNVKSKDGFTVSTKLLCNTLITAENVKKNPPTMSGLAHLLKQKFQQTSAIKAFRSKKLPTTTLGHPLGDTIVPNGRLW